jgi:hypothetical protein
MTKKKGGLVQPDINGGAATVGFMTALGNGEAATPEEAKYAVAVFEDGMHMIFVKNDDDPKNGSNEP